MIGTETYALEAIIEQKEDGKERRFNLHEENLQSKLHETIQTPTGGASIVKPSRPVPSILAQKATELKSMKVDIDVYRRLR